jgi:hypothetical protein
MMAVVGQKKNRFNRGKEVGRTYTASTAVVHVREAGDLQADVSHTILIVVSSSRPKTYADDSLSPLSDAYPPCNSVFTSATALAMPKGRVAPGKT